jgi:hypothetical protein
MIFHEYEVSVNDIFIVPPDVATIYSVFREHFELIVVLKGSVSVTGDDGIVIVHGHGVFKRHGAELHCDDEVTYVGELDAYEPMVKPSVISLKIHSDVLSRLLDKHNSELEHAVINLDDTVSCINA